MDFGPWKFPEISMEFRKWKFPLIFPCLLYLQGEKLRRRNGPQYPGPAVVKVGFSWLCYIAYALGMCFGPKVARARGFVRVSCWCMAWSSIMV